MRKYIYVLCALIFVAWTGCASSTNSNLEAAQFALDNSNYTSAISKANAVLNEEPNNLRAARILSSAYFGRSNLNFLDLAEAVFDLNTSSQTAFQTMADTMPDTADLDDLHSAIATLEAIDGIDGSDLTGDLADLAFDLGIMEVVEQFAIGVYQSDYKTALDVSGITSDGVTNSLNDLLGFDGFIINSGIASDEDFISKVRENFCILEPISAGDGFTSGEFQALVGCQLSTDPDTFDTTAFSAVIANCAALDVDNQSAGVQACFNQDTAL